MTIKIDNYLLEQEPAGILQWNVYKIGKVYKSVDGNNGSESKYNLAWSVRLPRAVEIVISDALMDDHREVTLLDYVGTYQTATARMTKEINNQLKQI